MRLSDLQHRKVGVLGYGSEGQAICACLQQRVPDAQVDVLCERPLRDGVECSYSVKIGLFTAELLAGYDILIKSPGVSLYHPAVQAAIETGTELTSGTSLWFAENPDARVVAITGTKGKSTTAALTAHLLTAGGLEVQLAGNIGVPLISRLDCRADVWVLELSSFQIADLEAQPELGVLVSLFAEHLDWHHSPTQYFADKLRLLWLAEQSVVESGLLDTLHGDSALYGELPADAVIRQYNDADGWHADSSGLMHAGQLMLPAADVPIRGRHNHVNACAALGIAEHFGVERAVAVSAVKTFEPLPHRLETVAEVNGVLYVNDSIATTPMAVVKALEAFPGREVLLIAGGFDQGANWQPLLDAIRQAGVQAELLAVKSVFALPDNGPALLRGLESVLETNDGRPIGLHGVADLEEAMRLAAEQASPDDVVLLSPGAPSFSQYLNFKERGRHFRRLVGELSNN